MAFNYTTPAERTLAKFASEEQQKIAEPAVAGMRKMEVRNHEHFSFSMNSYAKEKLTNAGIQLSPFSYRTHSHPVCKTLENYMFLEVLPSYIDNSFYVVSVKENKIKVLRERSKMPTLQFINRYVVARDITRYGIDKYFSSVEDTRKQRREAIKEMNRSRYASIAPEDKSIRDLVPAVLRTKARRIFLYDELHYWNLHDLDKFLCATRPEIIIATHIFPKEILAGQHVSFNKWAYNFEVKGETLHFYPDGVTEEGYEQPMCGGVFFFINKFTASDGLKYSVSILKSMWSHTLFQIARSDEPAENERSFCGFDATMSPELGSFAGPLRNFFPIRPELIKKIYLYLRTLKKPDKESAMAKLRQSVDEPTGYEIIFFENFATYLLEHQTCLDLFDTSLTSGFFDLLHRCTPWMVKRHFEYFHTKSLSEFIMGIDEMKFSIKCQSADAHFDRWSTLFPNITTVLGSDNEETSRRLVRRLLGMPHEDSLRFTMSRKKARYFMTKEKISENLVFLRTDIGGRFRMKRILRAVIYRVNFKDLQRIPTLFSLLNLDDFLELMPKRVVTLSHQYETGEVISTFLEEVLKVLPGPRAFAGLIKSKQESEEEKFNEEKFGGKCGIDVKYSPDIYQHHVDGELEDICMIDDFKSMRFEGEGVPCGILDDLLLNLSDSVDKNVDSAIVQQCACMLEIVVKNSDFTIPDDISFTDSLKGRRASFFSRSGQSMGYGFHLSKGWGDWIDNTIKTCGFQIEDFNECLAQKYEAGSSIPFNKDDEKGYPKGCQVLTVNLSGLALFEIKCIRGSSEFALYNGDYFLMPGGFQNSHKYSVKAETEVISLTFWSSILRRDNDENHIKLESPAMETCKIQKPRFKDCNSSGEFSLIQYGVMESASSIAFNSITNMNEFIINGDGNCFWNALSCVLGGDQLELREICKTFMINNVPEFNSYDQLDNFQYAENEVIFAAAATFKIRIIIFDKNYGYSVEYAGIEDEPECSIFLSYKKNHFNLLIPKEGCVIRSIAEALGRKEIEVLAVLSKSKYKFILTELQKGQGLPLDLIEKTFKIFGIHGFVSFGDETIQFNEGGQFLRAFSLTEDHMVFTGKVGSQVKLGETKIKHSKDFTSVFLASSNGGSVKFVTSIDRAKRLSESFLSGKTGKILSSTFSGKGSIVKDFHQIEVNAWLCLGTFGSGKSFGLKQMIQSRGDINFLIISPRRKLADAFIDELGIEKKRQKGKRINCDVMTFETALMISEKRKKFDFVALDEAQLYPPGYLDLICIKLNLNNILLLGDPVQSSYDSEEDREIFLGIDNDLKNILHGKEYNYVSESRRFRNQMFANRLPCSMSEIEKFEINEWLEVNDLRSNVKLIKEFDVILCPSFDEKKSISYILQKSNCQVMTYGESTGLTFKNVAVYISNETMKVDFGRMLVALSRARDNLMFVNNTGQEFVSFIQMHPGTPLHNFCCGLANITDLLPLLPGKPIFIKSKPKIGRSEREDRMVGDPWLKTMISLYARDELVEENAFEEELREKRAKIHLPVSSANFDKAYVSDGIREKFSRETRLGGYITEQFRDEYNSRDKLKQSNQCDLFEAIYPRHKSTDTATFLMAVNKRLSFSDPMINETKYRHNRLYGQLMLEHFLKFVPINDGVNPRLLEKAQDEFEEKKLSKSVATIENHSGRSNRDWNLYEAFIFMKSQLCTKFEKRFVDAKAGQTLACFSHMVLCRFAKWIRYIEKKVLEAMPENFYIHSGKNFEELKEWVVKSDFSGVCTESDYEAFDASQDSVILAFEVALMEYLHIPIDVINDYKMIKFNLYSKLGIFSIMRFTGEAGTFLFNTLANMCFTFMRYDLTGKECIAFAGDDMCANSKLRQKSEFEHILNRMKLKAKVDHKEEASFCGWILGPFGIYKKPQLVLERFIIAMEKDNLKECIDNYAIEVSYGYRLGDEMSEVMSKEELECQAKCARIIIKNAHLMKSGALKYFNGSLKESM